jgi:hypothetical protein
MPTHFRVKSLEARRMSKFIDFLFLGIDELKNNVVNTLKQSRENSLNKIIVPIKPKLLENIYLTLNTSKSIIFIILKGYFNLF